MKRARRRFVGAGLAVLAGGCSIGRGPAHTYYVLADPGTERAARRPARLLPHRLLVAAGRASLLEDGRSLVFSRAAGERAQYQFASWSERPSGRIAEAVVRRLESRGTFESVSPLGGGVGGDLVLTLELDALYHDLPSATAKLALTAELVERRAARLVGRRTFEMAAPVRTANAAGAVEAFGRALDALLVDLVEWVEAGASGAAAPASARRPSAPEAADQSPPGVPPMMGSSIPVM